MMMLISNIIMVAMVLLLRFIPNKKGRKITFDIGTVALAAGWAIHYVSQLEMSTVLIKAVLCMAVVIAVIAFAIVDFKNHG